MKISIKDKLKEKGMTRYELANRIDVTYPTIDKIYKGVSTSIKFENLEAICKELDCSPIEILIFDDKDFQERQLQRLVSYANNLSQLIDSKDKSDTQ